MTTQGSFNLQGLEEYLEQFEKTGKSVDEAAQEVVEESGLDIQAEMQNLVPVDTGNLFHHIQMDGPHQDGNFNYVDVGVIHDADKTDKETAIYGNVIEYGSARVAAQPYIRPALKKSRKLVRTAMQTILKKYGLT